MDNSKLFNIYEQRNFKLFSSSFYPKYAMTKDGKNKTNNDNTLKIDKGFMCPAIENRKFNKDLHAHAIITGKDTNLTVIDIDDPKNDKLNDLMVMLDDKCNYIEQSPRGYHYYFQYTENMPQTADTVNGVDVRSNGGFIFCAPSYYIFNEKRFEYRIVKMPKDNEALSTIDDELLQTYKKLYIVNNVYVGQRPKDTIIKLDKYYELINLFTTDELNNMDYNTWYKVGFALYNTSPTLLDVYDLFSSKNTSKYDGREQITKKWNSFKDKRSDDNIITIKTIYSMLEINHKAELEAWKLKHDEDVKFWFLMENFNHLDYAKLYYSLNPDGFIYVNDDKNSCWYSYDKYNVLVYDGNKVPIKLTYDLAERLQQYIINNRNKIMPPLSKDYTSEEEYKTAKKNYDVKMKLCRDRYNDVSNLFKNEGIIGYLRKSYTIDGIQKLIDNNINLIAFNNKVYDITTKTYRNINKNDYISRTTGYDYIEEINIDIKRDIEKIIYSIFEDQEMIDYIMTITGLSLFSNDYNSLYCLTGTGGNGKGLLSTMIQNSLGSYFMQAPPSFLTQIYTDEKNSTLANAMGIRYLSVSEPQENATGSCVLNIAFVKGITGRDIIKCRDLRKSVVEYKPFFTPFLQCNDKPTLSTVDEAVLRRLKVVKYPFSFKENPTQPHERMLDTSIKSRIENNHLYNLEFMRILIEYASKKYKINTIKMPNKCIEATNDYINENNYIKDWIEEHTIINEKIEKDQLIKLTDLRLKFNYDMDEKNKIKTNTALKSKLQYNNIQFYTRGGIEFLKGRIYKQDEEVDFIDDKNPLDS